MPFDPPDIDSVLWKERALAVLFNLRCGISLEDLLVLAPLQGKISKERCLQILREDKRLFSEEELWFVRDLDFFFTDRQSKDAVFVITDIETTGSVPGKNSLIELAAVKFKNGKILDRFESLVATEERIPWQIQKITGITNADLHGAPGPEQVLEEYEQFFDEGIFVAHNIRFDFFFLQGLYELQGSDFFGKKIPFCTLKFAQKMLPGVRACGISSLAQKFDLQIQNRHRAMGDVMATNEIFQILLQKIYAEKEDLSLHQLFDFHSDRKDKKGVQKSVEKKKKKAMEKANRLEKSLKSKS